jgi:hypothetical protein
MFTSLTAVTSPNFLVMWLSVAPAISGSPLLAWVSAPLERRLVGQPRRGTRDRSQQSDRTGTQHEDGHAGLHRVQPSGVDAAGPCPDQHGLRADLRHRDLLDAHIVDACNTAALIVLGMVICMFPPSLHVRLVRREL